MPGMKIRKLKELYLFFDNIITGKDNYKKERKKISKIVNEYQNGDNRKRLLDAVLKLEER